jgi:plastocyanin
MSAKQWIALIVIIPAVIVGGLLVGRAVQSDDSSSEAIQIEAADGVTDFEYDYLIPPGTASRIAAGQVVEIVPAELVVHVGDSIRITNNDSEDHIVGAFFVAAGEVLTQRFKSVGTLEGACSVHPSGSFVLRVEA